MLIVLCTVPCTAKAQFMDSEEGDIYLSVGYAVVNFPKTSAALDDFTRQTFGDYTDVRFDSTLTSRSHGRQFSFGMQFNRYFAAEANVLALENFTYTARGTAAYQNTPTPLQLTFSEKLLNYGLSARLFGPQVLRLQPYLRAGVLTTDAQISGFSSADAGSVPFDAHEQNETLYGGIGITWRGYGWLSVRSEWIYLPALDDTRGRAAVNCFTLELIASFK